MKNDNWLDIEKMEEQEIEVISSIIKQEKKLDHTTRKKVKFCTLNTYTL